MSNKSDFVLSNSKLRLFALIILLPGVIWLGISAYRQLVTEALLMLPSTPEAHDIGLRFGSDDPRLYSWIGTYYLLSNKDRDPQKAIQYFKHATELNPLYYQQWSELGAAYEMNGDFENAVAAYRNTVSLSLLRKGSYDEATAEFQSYLQIRNDNADYVFGLLYQINNNDLNRMVNGLAGLTGPAKPQLALFAISKKDRPHAIAIWNSMSQTDHHTYRTQGMQLANQLLSLHDYDDSRAVWNTFSPNNGGGSLILNSSFEDSFDQYPMPFGWQLSPPTSVSIAASEAKSHSGKTCLQIDLSSVKTGTSESIEQLIAPIPAATYRLSFFVSGDGLQSTSSPKVSIIGEDNKVMESSTSFEGKFDWKLQEIIFTIPPEHHAMILRISFPNMGSSISSGKIWFDDFSIEKR